MTINEFGQNSFVTHTTGLKERIQAKENQMRPYRGWTKDGKEVRGWYVKAKCDVHLIVENNNYFYERGESNISVDSSVIAGNIFEVIPETIGQFTGLKDKNGKEIYGSIVINGKMSKGGDIFTDENSGWTGDLYKVEWDGAGFRWFKIYDAHLGLYIPEGSQVSASIYSALGYEIIGNIHIHQNPELMEQNNDTDKRAN